MKWFPIADAPLNRDIYVWMPAWNGRGPLVLTRKCGGQTAFYWGNEYGNGSAPSNFAPEYWAEVPEGPNGGL